jgi:hypothetical protein
MSDILRTWFACLALSLTLCGSALAQSDWGNAEVDLLWQSTMDAALVERALSADEVSDALDRQHSAAELLMQAESGLLSLNARDLERLHQILAAPMNMDSQETVDLRGPSGTISGTVLEEGTGLPVTQGQVRAIPFGTDVFNWISATIQPDGSYSMNVPEGRYVLQTASHPEHVRQAWPDQVCVDGNLCSPWYGGEVIEVAAGASLTHDFELTRGVRVAGSVSDMALAPVAGSTVFLIARNRIVSATGTTQPDGSYQTSNALPPGDYRVFAVAPTGSGLASRLHDGQVCGNDCRDLPVTYLTLTNTTTPSLVNFQLADGVGLSGTVFAADGLTPLPDAWIQLQSVDGVTATSVASDGSGNYQFDVLRPADYVILVGHPQQLGQVHPGVNCFGNGCVPEIGTPVALGGSPQVLDFSLEPGSSVSGTVRRASDASPVEGAWVSVFNTIQGSRFGQTDASGTFTISGLTEGTFFVRVDPAQSLSPTLERTFLGNVSCPASNCGDFGQPVSVPGSGSVTGVDIDLALGGGLSGQIFDALTSEVLGFAFVPRLELWVASGPYEGQLAAQALSDEFGDYQITGLKPGAYKATFGTSTHLGLIDTAFGGQPCPRGSCDLSLLPTVFVTAGTTLPGISASLPRGPVVSGTITDSVTGQAPPFQPASNRIMAFYGTSGNYASFSSIDGDGFYRSRTGFPTGTFFVSTYTTRNHFPFGDNYIDQAYEDLDCPRMTCNLNASASPLTIAGADLTGIDFSLRKGARIEGSVQDALSSDALAGVGIEAYDTAGRLVALGVSNALGEYSIEALPSGDYFVRTRNLLGYQDQLHDGGSCTPFCDPVSGTTVAVTENATLTDLDFDLEQSAAISGTVNLSGSPLANVTVEVYGAIGNLLATTLSAADGSFAFNSLTAGEFYLRTRNAFGHADVLYDGRPCVGNACQVRRGDAIVLTPGSSVSGLVLDLAPGATISGEVHDRLSPATKLSGVRVQLLDQRGAVAFESTTGATGTFSFAALAAGDYHLVTRETPAYVDQTLGGTPCPSACNGLNGTPVSIAAGSTSSGNDLDLAPGASVSGNVTASGSPAVGAMAQVYNDTGVPVFQQPTNPSGNYEINELPDGDFFVRIRNVPGHVSQLWDAINCSGYCDILNGDAVTITGSTPVGSVNFSLPAGGSIGGQVTDGSDALVAVEVLAFDLSGFLAGSALTNSAGQYSISGLVNGTYRLRTANTSGFVDQVYGGSSCSPGPCVLSAGTGVNVAGGTVSGIDFSLTAGGSIAGTATDQFGNPLTSGTARLLDQNGIELDSVAIASGIWAFDGLADGTYFLLIENDLGLIDELYAGVPCPAGACDIPALGTPIVLGGGRIQGTGTTGINMVLSRGASISGQVSDAQGGDPLVGVTVFVRTPAGQLAALGVTDGLGEYQTAGTLPDGDYVVSTASGQQRGASGNYVNQLWQGVDCPLDCDLTQGSLVTLAGASASDIDFALASGAGVTGQISAVDNQPLVQVEVRFYDDQGYLAGIRRSDSQGRYSLDGLPAGSYFAHTVNQLGLADVTLGDSACDGVCDPLSGQSVSVPASGMVENVDFVLSQPDGVFADRFESTSMP